MHPVQIRVVADFSETGPSQSMCHERSDQRSIATAERRSDDRVSDGFTALRSDRDGIEESRRTRRNTSKSSEANPSDLKTG